MQIKMLRTMPGAADGIRHRLYKKDVTYDTKKKDDGMSIDLAKAFVKAKYAEQVGGVPEQKMVGASPENKAEGGAPDGKEQGQVQSGQHRQETEKVTEQARRGRGN